MENIEVINRVALEIGPLTVYWYGIIIAFGAFLGFLLVSKEAKRLGLDKDLFFDLLIWAIPISIISARIYYVIFEWEMYSENPSKVFAIWEGGIAIHGALIGAVLVTVIFAKKKGVSFWKIADIAAPGILLGQAIGRWGNFINQEAHGGAVSREFLENLYLPDFIINQMFIDGNYYQPTFLYESIWSLIGVSILILLRRLNLRRGEMFLIYIIWYSFGRLFIEGLRTDSLMLTESIRMAQFISVLLILVSIITLIVRRTNRKSKERYNSIP